MSLELFLFKLKYKSKNTFSLEKEKTMKLQKERKNLLKSTKHVLLQYFFKSRCTSSIQDVSQNIQYLFDHYSN
jgi:hypothetical protein